MPDQAGRGVTVLRVLVVAILITLLGRTAFLQIVHGSEYAAKANNNRVRDVATQAVRGQIVDDRGVSLVNNYSALVVSVNGGELRSLKNHGSDVLARLAPVVGIAAPQLRLLTTPCGQRLSGGALATSPNCWSGSPYQPVPVKSYDPKNTGQVRQVLAVVEHREDFPGVTVAYQAVRQYPEGTRAAHVLGYLGPISQAEAASATYSHLPPDSLVGRTGLEATYDSPLRGKDGIQELQVDKNSNVTATLSSTAAQPGSNLVLSLDVAIQKATEDALAHGIEQARTQFDTTNKKNYVAPNGAALVVDVTSGRLIAAASYPTYDPSVFVGGISTQQYLGLNNDPGKPLLDNLNQGLFAPGSTFKIVSTPAAIAAGNSLSGTYPCPSSITLGGRSFGNFEGEAIGNIDFRTTLIKSCDTVYYKLAYDAWLRDGATKNLSSAKEYFPNMARSFGFGSPTGVDLPSDLSGLISDRQYKTTFWNQNKANYCKGAQRREQGTYLQQLDQEFCTDGYRYNGGDAALFAIGQGDVLVTPLQLAMAYAAVANGGTVWKPRLAEGLLSADGRSYQPIPSVKKSTLPVAPETLAYIRDALAGVPAPGGTAQGAFAGFPLGQLPIAGKTGTADVLGKSPTSWFASFAPANAPQYAVVVIVPEGGTGGTTAAPIARQIYDNMYGLEGRTRLLGPGGALPSTPPVVRPDGSIGPPNLRTPPAPEPSTPAQKPSPQALEPGSFVVGEPPRRPDSSHWRIG